MAATSGVYAIINLSNGKRYVGSAESVRRRQGQHWRLLRAGKHNNRFLQRAWDKHGEQAFTFVVLEYVADKTQLVAREQFWIDATHCTDPEQGYNITPTAGSQRGYRHTPEERQRAKERVTDEQRERMRVVGKSNVGRKHDNERKQRISNHHKGERNAIAKLTEANVSSIKRLLVEGAQPSSLARYYGVTPDTITKIKREQNWAHVEPGPDTPELDAIRSFLAADRAEVTGRLAEMAKATLGNRAGSANSASRLNESTVAIIKRRLLNGENAEALGREYGVVGNTILFIKQGKTWRHVDPAPEE